MRARTTILLGTLALLALPVAAGQKAKSGRTLNGRVAALSAGGFDLQSAVKGSTTPTTTHVTTSGATRLVEAKPGKLADLQMNDLVGIVGETGPDGKVVATGVVRLWEASGELTRDQERLALAAVQGSRSILRVKGEKKKAAPAAPGTTATPATQPPAPKAAARPTIGRVVSLSPLQFARGGQPVDVTIDKAVRIAVISPIRLQDLKVGDGIAVVGTTTPAADPSQPATSAAQLVIKSPGKAPKKIQNAQAARAALKIRRANRRDRP